MKPLRPPKSTLSLSQLGLWTSQSPPGYTSSAAPAARAFSAFLWDAATVPPRRTSAPLTGRVTTRLWAS